MITNLFIGIGAQKAATSWIAKCLQEHPEVYVTSGKEVHFFNKDHKYEKGIDFYESTYYDSVGDEKICGEYSTQYLYSKSAPERMHTHYPDARLLVSLRNPFDRITSHIQHLLSLHYISKDMSLQEMIEKRPDILQNTMYGGGLQRFLNHYPASQILVLMYDDIKKNPKMFMNNIYSFLDVDSSFVPSGIDQKHNTSNARLSVLHNGLIKVYRGASQNALGRTVINGMRHLGINAYRIDRFLGIFSRKSKRFTLSEEDKRFIAESLKHDDDLLRDIAKKNGFYVSWNPL